MTRPSVHGRLLAAALVAATLVACDQTALVGSATATPEPALAAATATALPTPTPVPTTAPTAAPSASAPATGTVAASAPASPSESAAASPSASPSPSQNLVTRTPEPTVAPTRTPTPVPTIVRTPSPTPSPTASPSPTPSPTPSPSPSPTLPPNTPPSPPANATTGLYGKVTDATTGAPVGGLCVTVGQPGAFCWAITDSAGNYTIDTSSVISSGSSTTWQLYFFTCSPGVRSLDGRACTSPSAGYSPQPTNPFVISSVVRKDWTVHH